VPDIPVSPPLLGGDAAQPTTYISPEPRHLSRYRGTLVIAALLLAAVPVVWFAAGAILAGIEETAAWLQARDSALRRALVVVALITAAALIVIRAWSRASAPERPIELAGGHGVIGTAQVAAWLSSMLEARPGIRTAAARIENHHTGGVRVDVRVRVGPHARIDETLDAVDDAAEELLHHRLGVAMDGPPLVDVVYDELELRAGKPHD
jgi:hypothetical protein